MIIMKLKEMAQYLKMSPRKLYLLAQRGKIPCFKIDQNWKFDKDKVDGWLVEKQSL